MRKITIEVTADGTALLTQDKRLGFGGEHNAVTLCFELNNEAMSHFCNAQYFRVVIDGNYSDKLFLNNNEVSFLVPQSVMNPPLVHGQLVGYVESDGEPSVIAKSSVFKFSVGYSEIPLTKVNQESDVFEKALAVCTDSAQQSKESALLSAENALKSKEFADCAEKAYQDAVLQKTSAEASALKSEQYKNESKTYAEHTKQYLDSLDDTANALKGVVTGDSVVMTDVSPLNHDIKVSLLGAENLGSQLLKGQFIGKVQEVYDQSIEDKAWVMQGEVGVFEVSPKVVPVDNRTNLYVNIPAFYGGAAGLLLSDGTKYYTLYICNSNGGEFYCVIEDGEIYLCYDGETVIDYYFGEGFKIIGISCNGEGFEGNALDLYECHYSDGVKVFRGGKNLLDAETLVVHKNDVTSAWLVGDNSFTVKGKEGTEAMNGNAGYLAFPNATATEIKNKGILVEKGKTYTISFEYLLLETGKYSRNIGLLVYRSNLNLLLNDLYISTAVGEKKRFAKKFTAAETENICIAFRLNNNHVTISNIQLEEGGSATDFESFVAPTEYTPNADGTLSVPSLYPSTRLYTDTEGVTINAEYNKDTNKVINNLINAVISLGGNV